MCWGKEKGEMQQSPAFKMTRSRRLEAGLTLIEVLIAMVILAIGVYAVLRIFPRGFETIEAARMRTMATSLANGELERWKLLANDMYSMPEAIIATGYNGEALLDYNPQSATPAQLGELGANPLWEPESLWLPRTVIGERAIIPSSGNPFYVVSMGPLDDFRTSPSTELVQVYEADAFVLDSDASLGTREYDADYATGDFDFAAAYDGNLFTVTYSWVATDGTVRTEVGESQIATGAQFTIDAASDANFSQMVAGSERVYRCFPQAAGVPALGQFGIDSDSAVTGSILFNAADGGREIRINYRVADWSILREDHLVPSNLTVELAVSGVKGPNFTNAPRQPNEIKLPDGDNFVVAIDLATGDVYADEVFAAGQELSVNYRTGEVRFPVGMANHSVRVYYRARQDWALQIRKAAATYVQSAANSPNFRQFAWVPGSEPRGIYFAPSERGKVVAISYIDNSGEYISGELHTIPTAAPTPGYIVAPGTSGLACQITLNNTPDTTPAFGIVAHGVSFSPRVLWAARGRSTVPSDLSESGRPEYLNEAWRTAEVSTFLPTPMR